MEKLQIPLGQLILILLLLMISASTCTKKTDQETFTTVSEREIYDVINAVVKLRRLDTINAGMRTSLRIIDTLERTVIYFEPTSKPKQGASANISLPPPIGSISYKYLLSSKAELFSRKDSAFFIFQNQHPYNIILTPDKFNAIKPITFSAYRSGLHISIMIDNEIRYSILTLSTPIFSKDHTKAYLCSGYHCGGLCGYGEEYFLVKVNNKWQIKLRRETWVS